MKTLTKEAAVSKLVRLYARRLKALDAAGLQEEWDAVLGDEVPESRAALTEALTRDYEEWMGGLEPLELEAVCEDQAGLEVRVAVPAKGKRSRKRVA